MPSIEDIVSTYDTVVKVVDKDAKESAGSDEGRAYGGVVRSVKGHLCEYITEEVIKLGWSGIGGDERRLRVDSKKHKVKIKEEYVAQLKDEDIKNYINERIASYYYGISVDKQVYIDGKYRIGIECKAYTENAMIKRILVDFSLLKTKFPRISCYLFQLESQLGGDYRDLNATTYGSKPTHTLMSYFPEVTLNIFTMLSGERSIVRPIHKFYKPLESERIRRAVELLQSDLRQYL